MQANNLKYRLLDKLISIQDINLLEKVNELIGNVDANKSVSKVTPDQKNMLMKSEADILNEEFITDEELNEEEDKWLNG
ncbi:MAG TPA: hypothetical protein VMU83_24380 [Hanamia sp.]|nr:hypothetical protein [Hanamia sp.]